MNNKRKIFSQLELETFLLCLDRFKSAIENKKTDAITNKEKANAWTKLTKMFNSFPGVVKRQPKQLITFYKNLKRVGKKDQSNKRIQIFKTGVGPKVNAISNPVEERLVNKDSSDAAYHKTTNNDTTICENSCDLEESYDIIEVKCEADNVANSDTHSDEEVPLSSNPEVPSQEAFTLIQSQGSLQTVSSQAINSSNTSHDINTPSTKVYELRHGKRDLSAAAKAADSVIEQSELKQKILSEQHEWEREKFILEKENLSIKKEKQLLEIELLKEQVKMYQLMNEKIKKEGFQINVIP